MENTTFVYIYNPLKVDFITTYAEKYTPKEYIIHSQELMKLPKYLAEHIGGQLARKIAIDKGSHISWDIREAEARKEVFAHI